MPQMSPMSWTLILILLIGFMLLTLSSMSTMKTSSLNMKCMTKKECPMQW